jgi:orotate phosphoribosyltransferase
MIDAALHEALVKDLLSTSVRRGNFTLKSGRSSTWFIDSKQTICRPGSMLLVAEAVRQVLPETATAIGGLTMGADGMSFIAAAHATAAGHPLRAFSVRKEVKDHGGGGRIAGALEPEDQVVITEDTVTRGTSIIEAADVVAAFGARPVLLVALVDRGGTVAAMAEQRGYDFVALVTAPDLGFAYEGGIDG